MNKISWMDAAQVFDHWRVVPRTIFFGYCAWIIYVTHYLLVWYTHIPHDERDATASGLVTLLIGFITGLMPWIYRIYSDSSTDWSANQTVQKSTVVSTETVSK